MNFKPIFKKVNRLVALKTTLADVIKDTEQDTEQELYITAQQEDLREANDSSYAFIYSSVELFIKGKKIDPKNVVVIFHKDEGE